MQGKVGPVVLSRWGIAIVNEGKGRVGVLGDYNEYRGEKYIEDMGGRLRSKDKKPISSRRARSIERANSDQCKGKSKVKTQPSSGKHRREVYRIIKRGREESGLEKSTLRFGWPLGKKVSTRSVVKGENPLFECFQSCGGEIRYSREL